MGNSTIIISLLKYTGITCFFEIEVLSSSLFDCNKHKDCMDYVDKSLMWEIIVKVLFIYDITHKNYFKLFILDNEILKYWACETKLLPPRKSFLLTTYWWIEKHTGWKDYK